MQWDYWRLITLLSLAGFLGLVLGHMMPFLFVAALIYALWLQWQWTLLQNWLLKTNKNRPPSADGVIDDVRRQIERMRLQNSNRKKKLTGYLKRFKTATAAIPDGIVVIGEFGQVEWANQSAKALLGIHWPRDANLRVNNLLRDPAFHKLLDMPIDKNITTQITSPKNQATQLELKLVEYADNDRLLIARDVTQTIKLQRMRRDFVANVSHELRTPLTVLRGYLESFDVDSDPAMWRQALPVMQQQTLRMHLMIKDLLALSQLETGDKPLHHVPTDVSRLLQSIVDDVKRLDSFQDHQITLNCRTDKWLLADVDELRSAISNLVFNAVKYTPAGTKITINWTVDGQGSVIEVIDDGDGIASHHLERLTERFYRVDNGRDRESGGTGLGLAIVKHIVSRHKGRLEIQSELGEGAAFRCIFPTEKAISAPDI
ncbi:MULTISPECIES: phosphate regulon sensor histidine kinase PhoR [unclassified Methylophaga]|jgi:two-component system phosphate regulon sensor histidine kinase PhoR|uniref:phosphate regulon sensor histidine kinase PhoR n=1 Tax=unclassified Methylophaga TaxID=2629249 RepID=UPI000C8F9443|nr:MULTISPECIES: phosphate regulon sensor histidine kinase PhoR [unclassified Methylophaga]MAK66753.1 phosphate regulon sensor histidine kinase PhoR [Methylophaga sp.]MAY17679.1 phosphate regulon sensor histidine kinase PhoR [Methylophaga sp.]MBN47018.1 phosphate regulon sensor histidine kinase PhoR [Methylophaga sp.]HAO25985.1 phosphate regulon sensor histidine kinase PhoR [Methylophaga sp.]HCD06119.1 phosphate regulon sensor histidine kinase PhoR [Methylophaga sp.]|tara:strand:- start:44900 stop:46189 length:1290 start_codon:yes stop_codon:yes gene_type:complete